MILTKYCTILDIRGKKYILNTYNSSLVEVESIEKKLYWDENTGALGIRTLEDEEKSLLKNEGFLIDEMEDRQRNLAIRNRYHSSKYAMSDFVKIDIGITDNCNFHCSYCFENGHKSPVCDSYDKESYVKLFAKIEEIVKERIKNGLKKLEIVWYGGEPTLRMSYIETFNHRMIELTSKCGVEYDNILITNGYELAIYDEYKLRKQNVKYVQITIDGTKEVHNSRRNTYPQTDSFEIIMCSIEKLVKAGIEVVIRANVDKTNILNIERLIEYIADRFFEYVGTFLFMDIARVFGSRKSLKQEEFEEVYQELFMKAVKCGLIYPSFDVTGDGAFCGAETLVDNYVLDYKGNLYKCWNYIFDSNEYVGNIYNDENEEISSRELLFTEELSLDNVNDGKCLNCKYYKYCKGLCPHNRKMIIDGKEDNIYKNDACKDIVKRRISTYVEGYLMINES